MSRDFPPYRTEYRCARCSGALTFHSVMYSHGRCPLCGANGEHASGTIVETTAHAYRLLPQRKWWQFWIHQTRVYGVAACEAVYES